MPMPVVQTARQHCSLVWRNLQPRELTTTHTTGRQNKIFDVQIVERRVRTISVSPVSEGGSRGVRRTDI